MQRIAGRCFFFLLVVLTVTPILGQGQSQGRKPLPLIVDVEGPPPTLDGMMSRAEIVVHGTVLTSHPPEVGQPSRVVSRRSEIKVLELLKGPSKHATGSVLSVQQFGGTAARGGEEFATAYNMKILQPGDEVVLFLSAGRNDKTRFWIEFGDAGAFWVSGELAEVDPVVARMPTFANRRSVPKDDLLVLLRQSATRVRKH